MATREEDLAQKLFLEDENFRMIKEKHAELDSQLQALESKPYLTPQDEVENKKKKKKKLICKDEMQRIIVSHSGRI